MPGIPPAPDLGLGNQQSNTLDPVGRIDNRQAPGPYPGTVTPGVTTEFTQEVWSDEHRVAPYYEYYIHVDYDVSFGNLQLPTAPTTGTLQPSEIVATRLPYGRVTLVWLAERLGKFPVVPSPYTILTD